MRKNYVLLLVMLLLSLKAFSQEPRIDAIRAYYQEVKSQCSDSSEYIGFYHNQIITNVGNLQCRAVGTNQMVMDFWFSDMMNADDEENGDSINALCLLTIRSQVAAMSIYQEFLFKDGKLIFYFESNDNGSESLEYRYYYDKGKLIRFMQGREIIGYDGDPMEPIKLAAQYQDLFMKIPF